MDKGSNYFNELNKIDVSDKIEKRNGLSYLPWAFAWGELKKRYPEATYTIYENAQGLNYHTDGRTAWVKTGVTVEGIEYIEYLPVMDYRNNSISVDKLTSWDVNKTIQRSLTKAVARHGLGLYIYAKEDLPSDDKQAPSETKAKAKAKAPAADTTGSDIQSKLIKLCKDCGLNLNEICKQYKINRNSSVEDIAAAYYDLNNKVLRGEV